VHFYVCIISPSGLKVVKVVIVFHLAICFFCGLHCALFTLSALMMKRLPTLESLISFGFIEGITGESDLEDD